jgi:hypothetical protein
MEFSEDGKRRVDIVLLDNFLIARDEDGNESLIVEFHRTAGNGQRIQAPLADVCAVETTGMER